MTSNNRSESRNVDVDAARVLELAEKVFVETASDEELAELESLILEATELRRIYLRYALVHSQLAFTNASLNGVSLPQLRIGKSTSSYQLSSIRRNPWIVAAMVAAGLLFAVGIFSARLTTDRSTLRSNRTEAFSNDTTITSHYDNRILPAHVVGFCVAKNSENISSTTLNVQEGATGLRTTDGTDVQIEGPAKFGASLSSEGVLYHGSVRANLIRPNTQTTRFKPVAFASSIEERSFALQRWIKTECGLKYSMGRLRYSRVSGDRFSCGVLMTVIPSEGLSLKRICDSAGK